MATTGTVNSTIMKVWVGGTAITCLTDATISFTMEPRDTTCKDSNSYTNVLPGKKSWEVGGSANFAYDAANGFAVLFAAYLAGTKLAVAWGSSVTGDVQYGGDAYLTSLSGNASGSDENTTFDFTLMGVDAPEGTTN